MVMNLSKMIVVMLEVEARIKQVGKIRQWWKSLNRGRERVAVEWSLRCKREDNEMEDGLRE